MAAQKINVNIYIHSIKGALQAEMAIFLYGNCLTLETYMSTSFILNLLSPKFLFFKLRFQQYPSYH